MTAKKVELINLGLWRALRRVIHTGCQCLGEFYWLGAQLTSRDPRGPPLFSFPQRHWWPELRSLTSAMHSPGFTWRACVHMRPGIPSASINLFPRRVQRLSTFLRTRISSERFVEEAFLTAVSHYHSVTSESIHCSSSNNSLLLNHSPFQPFFLAFQLTYMDT